MATIDLHSKPFDESTITKLEIFEDYAKAWIPTFVMQKDIKEIHDEDQRIFQEAYSIRLRSGIACRLRHRCPCLP